MFIFVVCYFVHDKCNYSAACTFSQEFEVYLRISAPHLFLFLCHFLFIVGVQKAAQNGAQITKAHGTDMCCAFSFVGCASTAKRRQMFCLKQTNKKQQITEREKRNRQRPPNQPYGTNLRDIINCLFPFLFAFMIQFFFLRTYCI